MKKLLINYGGAMILYLVFILGILLISSDFLSPKAKNVGLESKVVMAN